MTLAAAARSARGSGSRERSDSGTGRYRQRSTHPARRRGCQPRKYRARRGYQQHARRGWRRRIWRVYQGRHPAGERGHSVGAADLGVVILRLHRKARRFPDKPAAAAAGSIPQEACIRSSPTMASSSGSQGPALGWRRWVIARALAEGREGEARGAGSRCPSSIVAGWWTCRSCRRPPRKVCPIGRQARPDRGNVKTESILRTPLINPSFEQHYDVAIDVDRDAEPVDGGRGHN
jgi:hypothetical protein